MCRTLGAKTALMPWVEDTSAPVASGVFAVRGLGRFTAVVEPAVYSPFLTALPDGGYVLSKEDAPAPDSAVAGPRNVDVELTVLPG